MSLSLQQITITDNNGKVLLPSLSLAIKPGEILSVMGPSGCGKSTLLNLIAGHQINDFKTTGDIYLSGNIVTHLAPQKRNIGMLFQDDLLFPHLNIWQNLALALPNSVKKQQRKEIAMNTLAELDLLSLANNAPANISGGQRARISMMRMLLAKPAAVLLDEPFNKLDNALRENFRQWVFRQIKARNLPTLMVTHDHSDIADKNAVLLWPEKQGNPQ